MNNSSYIGYIRLKVMTDILHHLARLEMMMAEERGIDLSYIEALEIVKLK